MIGSFIGRTLDVDLVGSGVGNWKKFVRVRVEIDVNCPLIMEFPLECEHLLDLWISFKYEKLRAHMVH